MLDGDIIPGSSFEASSHPFAEFSLCKAGEEVLRLRYVPDTEVETHNGIAYQSGYNGQHWMLQFYRTPFLQRESYRVVCNDTLVASTEVFKPLRTAALTYSDGTIWQCHTKIFGAEVDDSDGNRMLHASPKVGLLMGKSSLHIDHAIEVERALPLFLILTHFTTHSAH